MRHWHQHLLRRRIAFFAGRISDRALDHSLRLSEYVLAMYLLGLVCAAVFVVAELLGAGGYGYAFIAVGFAQAAVLGTLAMRSGGSPASTSPGSSGCPRRCGGGSRP